MEIAMNKPVPRSNDLDCTNAYIMRDALQRTGFYAEIADYEAPGRSRYGTYNPAPIILTNASKSEVLTLFPDLNAYDEDEQQEYYENVDPVMYEFSLYTNSWTPPVPSEPFETAPDTLRYWFPDGVISHDDWIQIKVNQPTTADSSQLNESNNQTERSRLFNEAADSVIAENMEEQI